MRDRQRVTRALKSRFANLTIRYNPIQSANYTMRKRPRYTMLSLSLLSLLLLSLLLLLLLLSPLSLL